MFRRLDRSSAPPGVSSTSAETDDGSTGWQSKMWSPTRSPTRPRVTPAWRDRDGRSPSPAGSRSTRGGDGVDAETTASVERQRVMETVDGPRQTEECLSADDELCGVGCHLQKGKDKGNLKDCEDRAGSDRFLGRPFSISQLHGGSPCLLSVAVLPSPPPKQGTCRVSLNQPINQNP